jgi:hypothetical protein
MTLISAICEAGEPHSMTVDVLVMEKPGVEPERLDIRAYTTVICKTMSCLDDTARHPKVIHTDYFNKV